MITTDGSIVQATRSRLGLTVRDAAKGSGVSEKFLAELERGEIKADDRSRTEKILLFLGWQVARRRGLLEKLKRGADTDPEVEELLKETVANALADQGIFTKPEQRAHVISAIMRSFEHRSTS